MRNAELEDVISLDFGELVNRVFGFVGGVIDFHVCDVLEVINVPDFKTTDVESGAGFQIRHQLALPVSMNKRDFLVNNDFTLEMRFTVN